MDDLKYRFGERVRTIRQKRKLSQEKLAERVEISVTNMGKIERGESFVTAGTLEKIANALDVKIQDFFMFDTFISVEEMKKELCIDKMSDEQIRKLYKFYKHFVNN